MPLLHGGVGALRACALICADAGAADEGLREHDDDAGGDGVT